MRKGRWLLPALLMLTACGTEDASVRPAANRKPNYFDVKSLLDKQIAELNRRQPVVEKQVRLRNGKLETTRVTKTDWSKELQVFYQADINKPALRGAYAESVGAPYSNTEGRSVYAYTRKPDANASVESLTISALGASGPTDQLEKLTAVIKQDNALFYSEKTVHLSCNKLGKLTGYSVEGVQKLIMFDTVRYSVRTRVLD